jgi:phenylalanyl-tRNA synthetase beta chain
MKVLLSWMKEFAPLTGDPVAIGDDLSDLGLAVEEMTKIGSGLDGIVVAEVLELRPHPDADRIQLVDVDLGDGEALQICCGAFNMAVGDLVPLATLGATLPDGMEIARRKMRGEWSNGMLCAPDEIGLGSDHDGILILPAGLNLGTPFTEAMGITPDVLYDLEVNPNRPDAMSVAGVARDLAARQRVPFEIPVPDVATAGSAASEAISVAIEDTDLCGRFAARVIRDVSVGESPAWMASRLMALGMRPINLIVDVSNYVMLELGYPNHAFDLSKVNGAELIIRSALEGEQLVTLDGIERTLEAADGVIADGTGSAISLAAVMGGATTEISDSTTDVLLEMAWWNPPRIARTARRLGLRSEASARFERGTDPEIIPIAMLRFADLLGDSGATLAPGMVDAAGVLPTSDPVTLRVARMNKLLGTEITTDEATAHLERIGFAVTPAGEDLTVTIPSFRPDTATEIDVIEEVARHHGYANIPTSVPPSAQTGSLTDRQRDRRTIRGALVGLGASEAMPLPFLAPGDVERAGISDPGVAVANPLAAEESIMRSSLRPGLLKAVAYNESHRNAGVSLFEIGKIWAGDAQDPDEREQLALLVAGVEAPGAVEAWNVLSVALGFPATAVVNEAQEGLHDTRSGRVEVEGTVVGRLGEISPAVLEAFEITERVACLELDLTVLLDLERDATVYTPVSHFPSSDIDLAFVVADSIPAAMIEATLREAGGELAVEVRLFDVFRSDRLGPEQRSLAYAIRFQAVDRTLKDAEVAAARQSCIDAVIAAHGAELRG